MNLLPLSAFSDNYIWLLHNGKQALVVDPGDAAPVLAALQAHGLQLQAILVTHHHADHVGGVDKLRSATGATVYGPAYETLPEPVIRVDASTELQLLGLNWRVLEVPGHTAVHIAWYCEPAGQAPILFCGDTLFSGGCGRLFEGTPEQMHASLQQLAQLPGHTRVACAHEYTLSNPTCSNTARIAKPCASSSCPRCLPHWLRNWQSTLFCVVTLNKSCKAHCAFDPTPTLKPPPVCLPRCANGKTHSDELAPSSSCHQRGRARWLRKLATRQI